MAVFAGKMENPNTNGALCNTNEKLDVNVNSR